MRVHNKLLEKKALILSAKAVSCCIQRRTPEQLRCIRMFLFANSSSSSMQILSPPPPPPGGSFLSVFHECVNLRPLRFVTLAVWNADVPIARLSLLISLHHPSSRMPGNHIHGKGLPATFVPGRRNVSEGYWAG